ncbi:MAG: AraC family transcriptional regulator [Gammaproteobacteria bacterium]
MGENCATTASEYARTFETTDPELLSERFSEFAGEWSARRLRNGRFRAEVAAAILPDVRIARLRSHNFRVVSAAERDVVATTVPVQSTFDVHQPGGPRTFESPAAYVLGAEDDFSLSVDDGSQIVVGISTDALSDAAERLLGEGLDQGSRCGNELSLLDEVTASFVRTATGLWSAARQHPESLSSRIGRVERQTEVVEKFLLATSRQERVSKTEKHRATAQAGMRRAEDWIREHLHLPITRTELCRISGLNARTLTRAFLRHHGMSPIMFVRARRLDHIHLELLSADPDCASVTGVAFDHGFTQLGRFAADYRRQFGELPSATLHT